MILIDGRATAKQIKLEIIEEIKQITNKGGAPPHLAVVLVGNNSSSETYVTNKIKICKEVGVQCTLIHYENSVTESKLLATVNDLNKDENIDGFIIQLPLPKHISEQKIIESISYKKDVDGFHPINVGRMVIGLPCFVPATPKGIFELLKRYKIETIGKHCVILGRSNIVGKPIANLLAQKTYPGNCTLTICHNKTINIKKHCLKADIIVSAIGVPEFLKGDMVKYGAVVIDVGITRVYSMKNKSEFQLKGDVLFEEVAQKCSYISPVPGGVGPMTIISLIQNTLLARKKVIY
jgi:methylenetetrahydrofolate dehydrogenase (NADP+)/methenyltetrahydrofolate cyclohydrolase